MRTGQAISAQSKSRRFGVVTVHFIEPDSLGSSPTLNAIADTVTIPVCKNDSLARLPHDRFLFYSIRPNLQPRFSLWFGGTDEGHPFLTQLSTDLWDAYRHGGASAFFRRIIPDVIRRVARDRKQPILRQGDIYATRIFDSWQEFGEFARVFDNLYGTGVERQGKVRNEEIFATRHCLTGFIAGNDPWSPLGADDFIFAEGVLAAPDHRPIRLQGVHVVQQMDCLIDNAD